MIDMLNIPFIWEEEVIRIIARKRKFSELEYLKDVFKDQVFYGEVQLISETTPDMILYGTCIVTGKQIGRAHV